MISADGEQWLQLPSRTPRAPRATGSSPPPGPDKQLPARCQGCFSGHCQTFRGQQSAAAAQRGTGVSDEWSCFCCQHSGSIWTAAASPLSGGLEENSVYPLLLSFRALSFLLRTGQEIIYSLCVGVGVLELKNQNGFFWLKPCSVLELLYRALKYHMQSEGMCPLSRNTLEQPANINICSKHPAQSRSGGNLSVKKLLWKVFN